jgi:prepilin-type N-terminal cleavage/methylation domain-containing protein
MEMSRNNQGRGSTGFTIVELLVVVAIISLLIAILLPALGRARDGALITQSLGNLRNMAAANATYGADYGDRQFQAAPDDVGIYGSCQARGVRQLLPARTGHLRDQPKSLWSVACAERPGVFKLCQWSLLRQSLLRPQGLDQS